MNKPKLPLMKKIHRLIYCVCPTLLASCAPSLTQFNAQSATTSLKLLTPPVYPAGLHTANFVKPIKHEAPGSIDSKYNRYRGYLAPELILSGRKFLDTINQLTKDDITNDIKDSLVELVNNNPNISIDFDHLKINFNLNKNGNGNTTVESFLLELDITNKSINVFNLFDGISIAGLSNAHVRLSLFQGVLTPSYALVSDVHGKPNNYAAAWNLAPNAYNFTAEVTYHAGSLQGNVVTLQPATLKLLTSRSYAMNMFFNQVADLPDYQLVSQYANDLIAKESSSDLKKDINDWFLTYFRMRTFLYYRDIKLIINYLMKPNYLDDDGKVVPILKVIVENPAKRDAIFKNAAISPIIVKLLDALFQEKTDKTPPKYEEIAALVLSIMDLKLDEFLEKDLDLKTVWYDDPTLSRDGSVNRVSFNFKLVATFKKDFTIPFKGQHMVDGKMVQYDFNKYINLKRIFGALGGGGSSKGGLLDGIIGSLQGVLLFDKLEVKKGESFSVNFSATNSPIIFNAFEPINYVTNSNVDFGFTVTDVNMTFDASNLKTLWNDLFLSLNKITIDYSKYDTIFKALPHIISEGKNLGSNFQFRAILEILTYFFLRPEDKDNWNIDQSKRPNHLRPVERIINFLIRTPINLSSVPLSVYFSRAFLYLPDTYKDQPLYNQIKNDVKDNSANSTYVANNDLSLDTIVGDSSQLAQKLADNNDVKNHANLNQFAYVWKDQKMKNYFDYYGLRMLSKNSIYFNSDSAYEAINQILTNVKTNEEFEAAKAKLLNAVKSNLTTKGPDIINPKVSVYRFQINTIIQQIFAGQNLSNSSTALSITQALGVFNLHTLLVNAVPMDSYLIFINFQTSSNLFSVSKSGDITFLNQPYILKFIAPKFDFTKINVPFK